MTGTHTIRVSESFNDQTLDYIVSFQCLSSCPAQLPPSAVSITPSMGSGFIQTFTYVTSDANGASDIETVYFLLNSSLSEFSACSMKFDRPTSQLWLRDADNTTWLGPVILGTPGMVTNGLCTVIPDTSAATLDTNLTVSLALTFRNAFAGNKVHYLQGVDAAGTSSGWAALGTWIVPKRPGQITSQ